MARNLVPRMLRVLRVPNVQGHLQGRVSRVCGREEGADSMVKRFAGRIAWLTFVMGSAALCGLIIAAALTGNL